MHKIISSNPLTLVEGREVRGLKPLRPRTVAGLCTQSVAGYNAAKHMNLRNEASLVRAFYSPLGH